MGAVVGELHHLSADFNTAAKIFEPGMQRPVGAALRDQPGVGIWGINTALSFGHHPERDGDRAEVDSHRRVQRALVDDVAQSTQIIEYLQGAGLDTFGARPVEGVRRLVY